MAGLNNIADFFQRPQVIGLDLDGTLVDSAPDIVEAANATLAEIGLPTLGESRIRMMIGDGIDTLLLRCLDAATAALGDPGEAMDQDLPVDDPEALFALARPVLMRHYGARVFERGRIFPGVPEALDRWRDEGIELVCITNKASRFAEPLLRKAGLWSSLAGLYCADNREDRKPAPRLIQRCLEERRVLPCDFLMIGDSMHDVCAAAAAGCPAVVVSYGYGELDGLASSGRPVVARLDDLRFG